ncbi:MAG: class SAM-dependent methyltransferase [Gemmataceae bacterium]|nr:class SAM-dependent methyltransferase [Gemmataceae bacterium]
MNATDPATNSCESGKSAADLPDYEAELMAFHRAFGRELRRAVRAIPINPGDRVLDVPCGDGFYTVALARRLYPFGRVTAADLSAAYLETARRAVARHPAAAVVDFATADAYRLPFDDDTFDLVWCAQSLISLDNPVVALNEMRRVTRPGGAVAVMEDDEFHRVMMNWPVALELDLQRAVAEAARVKYGSRAGLSPARGLRRDMIDAGLSPAWKQTVAADRQAPFDPAVRAYLRIRLRQTRDFVAAYLSADQLAVLDRAIDPGDEQSLLRRPDAELTCLTTLFLARK